MVDSDIIMADSDMADSDIEPPQVGQYHRKLDGKNMHRACNGFQVMKITDIKKKNEQVFSLLVSRESANSSSLSDLKKYSTSLNLNPLNRISYLKGEQLAAVLYRPFTTLFVLRISSKPDKTDFYRESSFVPILQGWIADLNHLRSQKVLFDISSITALTLVVSEDSGCGAFLYTPTTPKKGEERDSLGGTKDLSRLVQVILNMIGFKKIEEMNDPTLLSLKTVLQCLPLSSGATRRARIFYSPYLLTNKDKVFVLIPKFFDAASVPGKFRTALMNEKIAGWKSEMLKAENRVFYDIYLFKAAKYKIDGLFSFLVCLRNCVVHLGKVCPVGGEWNLNSEPEKFLDFINAVYPNFFDQLFKKLYDTGDKFIPMFDRLLR